jgi:Zn-dependent peptidase ImmA (M78 family)
MSELIIPSHQQVRQCARGALSAADALEVAPVPIEDVIAAVGLHKENLFTMGAEDLPPRILALAKKFSGRVLGAMAIKEKVLYVDESLATPRRRFTQAHEVGHQALPWHEDAYFVDNRTTLRDDTRDLLEQEANVFAAEVLFGLNRFTDEVDSYAPSLAAALSVATKFGASGHAALRRYAATSSHPVALIAFGRYLVSSGAALTVFPNQCASSRSFTARYGDITSLIGQRPVFTTAHPALATLATQRSQVNHEVHELRLDTKRGVVPFQAHLFFNGRLRFALLTRKSILGRRIGFDERTPASA